MCTSHSSITPRSSWYWTPSSSPTVARGSRSRLRAFCDLAYVHERSGSSTNQSGTRCGSSRGPFVAHCMTIFSARKARASSSDISIWLRRDGKLLRGLQHRGARGLGLEHHRAARLLEDLAGQPLVRGEGALEDQRAVRQLGAGGMVLAHPPGALGGHPDLRSGPRLDLAGGQPAVHVGLDAGARLECLVEHVHLADTVEPVRAGLVLVEVPGVDVPALL